MIQSHLIQHIIDGRMYLIYDTVVDSKHIYTACGIGRVRRKETLLSDTARATLNALLGYVDQTHDWNATIRFQEIATIQAVPLRVRKALQSAHQKEIVFYVCRGPDVYDAAIVELNILHNPSPLQ